jgi:hypothetical protein
MGSMRPLLADRETAANPLRLLTAPAFFLPERTMAAVSPFLIILLAWDASRRRRVASLAGCCFGA